MLLLPLALTACAQPASNVAQPATTTAVSATTVTQEASTVTETATSTAETTVEPADGQASSSVFTMQEVRIPAQAASELVIQDVRAGTHDGFDRVVFEYAGQGLPGVIAGYNPEPRQQASGYPLDVPGTAFFELMIQGTPMMLMSPREDLIGVGPVGVGAGNVVNVVHGGVFEADTQYVIGLNEQKPYNVYILENPPRVVVDFQQ